MFLKNYTSDVPVSQTIYRIEQILIRCGVSGIMKEYAAAPPGCVSAITFQLETPSGKITIRLPADDKAATDVLWLDYVGIDELNGKRDAFLYPHGRKKKNRSDFVEQGSRTAWKIIQDWVEVQMSMIVLKQAEPLQVFLPYVYNGKETYYAAIKAGGFHGLIPETTS